MKGTWEERMGRANYEAFATEIEFSSGGRKTPWDLLHENERRAWAKGALAAVHKASEGNPREDRMK